MHFFRYTFFLSRQIVGGRVLSARIFENSRIFSRRGGGGFVGYDWGRCLVLENATCFLVCRVCP